MLIHAGVKEYICDVCGKQFTREHNMQGGTSVVVP